MRLFLHHQYHYQLAPSAYYFHHLIVQHQPDNQGKDSVFTSNTDVSVINQMKNKKCNGPHQRRRIFGAVGHVHSVGPQN
jgi:hypothetical protein